MYRRYWPGLLGHYTQLSRQILNIRSMLFCGADGGVQVYRCTGVQVYSVRLVLYTVQYPGGLLHRTRLVINISFLSIVNPDFSSALCSNTFNFQQSSAVGIRSSGVPTNLPRQTSDPAFCRSSAVLPTILTPRTTFRISPTAADSPNHEGMDHYQLTSFQTGGTVSRSSYHN